MSFFRQLMLLAAQNEVKNIVLAMPHRGKLNLLTTIFNTPPAKIFHKFKGFPEFPSDVKAMGDIASHFRKYICLCIVYTYRQAHAHSFEVVNVFCQYLESE